MTMTSRTPEELLREWRASCWPPKGMRKLGELPIYIGDHEAVAALSASLGEVMALLSEHVFSTGRNKAPRWMAIPKIEFLVVRMNIVATAAKASRRFSSITKLEASCGALSVVGAARLREWFDEHRDDQVVAHKPFVDLRAYVFQARSEAPKRHRFYQSGLVVSAPPGQELLVQDNRRVVRAKRSDRLVDPLVVSADGWEIYPAKKKRLQRRAEEDHVDP